MKILLVGQPLYNRGDESAHKGLIRSLLKAIPDVEISVLEIDARQLAINEFDMKQSQVKWVNLHATNAKVFMTVMYRAYKYHMGWMLDCLPTWRKVIKRYEWADVIMMAPGGINLGGFQDWKHLSMLLLARKMAKPLVYYGRSIGPFRENDWTQRRFKNLAREALNYCSFVSLRDAESIQWANELNVKCTPTVDSAFLDSIAVEIPTEVERMIGSRKYITFVPNELIWHFAYRSVLPSDINGFYLCLMDIVHRRYPDYRIVMLPQTSHQPRNDYSYFCELRERCPYKEDIIVIPDIYSSDVQQAVIHKAALMIGARYHSIVFAINQATPFISLSYEHKMSGLLKELGNTERMIDITKIFSDSLEMENAIRHYEILVGDLPTPFDLQSKAKNIARACFEACCVHALV